MARLVRRIPLFPTEKRYQLPAKRDRESVAVESAIALHQPVLFAVVRRETPAYHWNLWLRSAPCLACAHHRKLDDGSPAQRRLSCIEPGFPECHDYAAGPGTSQFGAGEQLQPGGDQ